MGATEYATAQSNDRVHGYKVYVNYCHCQEREEEVPYWGLRVKDHG